jgi:hypothetical protein
MQQLKESTMKTGYLCAALATLALAGCGGGSDYSNNTPPQQQPPPNQGPVTTPFPAFVKSQLAATSDTAEPVSINDLTFDFGDIDDPNAFSDVPF